MAIQYCNYDIKGTLAVNGASTLSGAVTIVESTSSPLLNIFNNSNGSQATIKFSDQTSSQAQFGTINYAHSDSQSYGSDNSFILTSNQTTMTILADGKLMYKEGIYSKPSSGTGAGTRKDNLWDSAYTKTNAFTTIGTNFTTIPNVSVVSYTRINANETVSLLSASQFLTAIGGAPATGGGYLPVANPTFTGTLTGPAATITTVTGSLVGNASSASKLISGGSLTTQAGTSTLIHTGQISNGTTGLFPASDNANSIITVNRHPGNYYSQLGFSSNGNLYYRKFQNTAINTTQAWLQIAIGSFLPLAGGTVTGQINGITPTAAANLTRKDYVDTAVAAVGTVRSVTSGDAQTITIGGTAIDPTIKATTGTVSSSSSNLATGAQIQTAINTATTGALKFVSEWDASGTIGGSPDLRAVATHIPGNYYIVSVAGSSTPNGAGNTPNEWEVGDWCIRADLATDTWQKIDNTQVGNVTGAGSSGRVAFWNGNSNITSDGDLTFDGANLTVGGQIVLSGTGRIQGIDVVSAAQDAASKTYVDNANSSGYATSIFASDNRTVKPNEFSTRRLNFGFTSWDNDDSSPYADFIHMASYPDSSGGNVNMATFKKSGIGMRIWQQGFNSASAYSNYEDVYTTADPVVKVTGTPVNNQIAVWTNGNEIEGESELTYDGATFSVGGSNNTSTFLDVVGTNTAGAPAISSAIRIYGYEGRAEGIFYYDTAYADDEWYSGLPYSGGSTYQIGFDTSGGQAEYVANSVLSIASNGQVTFNKYGTSSPFTGTLTNFTAFAGDGKIIERTPAQVLSDIGGASAADYLPKSGGAMTGSIAMGNNDITKVNNLEFNTGSKFDDNGGANYIRLIYNSAGAGGLQIIDSDSQLQGYLYASGAATSEFGLLSGAGEWAVRTVENGLVELRHDNSVRLTTTTAGVSVTGDLVVDGGDITGSNSHKIISNSANNNQLVLGDVSDGDEITSIRLKTFGRTNILLQDETTTLDDDSVFIKGSLSTTAPATFLGLVTSTGELTKRTPAQLSSDIGAVLTSGNQTIGGTKTFSTAPIFQQDSSSRSMYIDGAGNIIQFRNAATVNKWEVVGRDGQFYIYKNDGTGSGIKWQIDGSGNHNLTGVVTLNSGSLLLSGTGRIQGIDTVSASTDAANKAYVDNFPGTITGGGAINQLVQWSSTTGIINTKITSNAGLYNFNNYTSSSVATTGSLSANQNAQAASQDTLANVCVDPGGNMVRGSQEGTWTYTAAQLNALTTSSTAGPILISAPGANKAIIIEETNWMVKYSGTGSMATTQAYEVRQAIWTNTSASISRLPSTKINEIMNAAQGTPSNPSYGFYSRDVPDFNNDARTFNCNKPTRLNRLNTNGLPGNLISISIKLKYRLFDATTF